MKKLILLTLLLIGNYSFSQENQQEIVREQERLEDLARSAYYQKGGKLLFYDIFNQSDRWGFRENMTADQLRSYIKDLEQVKAKWEAPNGPLELALSRIDEFHIYNNKICSTYGEVKTPNSDHIMDWCKIRDDYKKKYPRKSGAYENAMGYWQKFYNFANQQLEKKVANSSNSNTNSNQIYNSRPKNSNNNSSQKKENNNTSSSSTVKQSTSETYSERLQRQERERKEHAQKLAREHQEWANKQEAKRISDNKAAEEIADGIIAIGKMFERSPEQIARSKKRRARNRGKRQASFSEYKETYKSSIRVFGGLTLAQFDYKDRNDRKEYKLKTGFHLGALAELFPISEIFAFETGLIFASKGEKSTFDQADGFSVEKTNLYYLEIPITLKTSKKFKNNSEVNATFGPYFGTAIFGDESRDSTDSNGETTTFLDEKIDFDETLNRIDYGLNLGLGLDINRVFIGLSYKIGLADITQRDRGIKNSTYNFSLGYKIK